MEDEKNPSRTEKKIVPSVKTGMLVHQVRGVRSPQRFPGDGSFVAATPITEAFQYNAWLQQKIRKSKIGPTSATQKYFEGESSMQFIENLINDSMSKMLKSVQGGHSVASVGSLDLSGYGGKE